ncbi:MAG: hypothetical protein MI861_26385 [Pirellulales bacterium]|nr:hypothetical protein [Pirellulales bacterium]
MKLLWMITLAICPTLLQAQDWKPPGRPNPSVILDEAERDAADGNYSVALAKHAWFHNHALEYSPALYGVRLSFALSSWIELAKDYPPALTKLKSIRDQTAAKLVEDDNPGPLFHDFASINSALGEERKTVAFFKRLHKDKPDLASVVFLVAKPTLLKSKEYELCLEYIQPRQEFKRLAESYRRTTLGAKRQLFSRDLVKHAEKTFEYEAASLIALMTVSDDDQLAAVLADAAKDVLKGDRFHKTFESAKAGVFPQPYP